MAGGVFNPWTVPDTLNAIWIGAEGIKAPGVKPATWVDLGISGVWEFTDGTDDTIVANIRVPYRMDRTIAPTFMIGWSSPVVDPGDLSKRATWQVEYLWRALDENLAAAAEETISVTLPPSAIVGGNGLVRALFTLGLPGADAICLHLRIKRRGDLDSLGDVARVSGICLRFTANRLGGAID